MLVWVGVCVNNIQNKISVSDVFAGKIIMVSNDLSSRTICKAQKLSLSISPIIIAY